MVRVAVGKGPGPQQIFTVYRDVICNAAPWFETELNKHELFVDSKTSVINIEFTTPDIFGLFQQWSLGGGITYTNKKPTSVDQLVNLWILAGIFQAPVLQNVVIKALFGKVVCQSPEEFKFLYQNTTPDSPLRRLFIRGVMVRSMSPEALSKLWEDHWDDVPQAMIKEVLIA